MAHETNLTTVKVENVVSNGVTVVNDLLADTDPATDSISVIMDLPLDDLGEEVDLPITIGVIVRLTDDSNNIDSIEIVSESIANLTYQIDSTVTCSGDLPQIYFDDTQQTETVFFDTDWIYIYEDDSGNNPYSRWRILNNRWEFELINTNTNSDIMQFVIISAGSNQEYTPVSHPWKYCIPEKITSLGNDYTHNAEDPWEAPSEDDVDPDYDPFLERVPGTLSSKVREDKKLGLQRCLVFVNNNFNKDNSNNTCC